MNGNFFSFLNKLTYNPKLDLLYKQILFLKDNK